MVSSSDLGNGRRRRQIGIGHEIEFGGAEPDVITEHEAEGLIWRQWNAVDAGAGSRVEVGDPIAVGIDPKLCMATRDVHMLGWNAKIGLVAAAHHLPLLKDRPQPDLRRDVGHYKVGSRKHGEVQILDFGLWYTVYSRTVCIRIYFCLSVGTSLLAGLPIKRNSVPRFQTRRVRRRARAARGSSGDAGSGRCAARDAASGRRRGRFRRRGRRR